MRHVGLYEMFSLNMLLVSFGFRDLFFHNHFERHQLVLLGMFGQKHASKSAFANFPDDFEIVHAWFVGNQCRIDFILTGSIGGETITCTSIFFTFEQLENPRKSRLALFHGRSSNDHDFQPNPNYGCLSNSWLCELTSLADLCYCFAHCALPSATAEQQLVAFVFSREFLTDKCEFPRGVLICVD